MIRNKTFLIVFLLGVFQYGFSQTETPSDTLPDPQIEQAAAMVEAVEYYFNLVGSKRTKTQEKETIINESYKKLFLNDRVQVEDDLQENRSTQIFKDIQAYLKDIDFFFQEVLFDFEINKIERLYTTDSLPYFKADITRNLSAIGIQGDTLKISGQRFIELNFDGPQREIKVASIYTDKIDRARQLKSWWLNLSLGWKKIFQDEIGIYDDSLTVDELTRIAGMDSLDLSNNDQVVNLDPIYVLTDLAYLKLSNSFITDLSPLLSINRLKVLDVSETSVHDLSPLKYHTDIEKMILYGCHITDFGVLGFFEKLKVLDMRDSQIADLSFISSLISLNELNLSGTAGGNSIAFSSLKKLQILSLKNSMLTDLNGFGGLESLNELNLEATGVNDIQNLSGLSKLSVLNISNTKVKDISALIKMKSLKKVYVDDLPLGEAQIDSFIKNNDALLIRNTEELQLWWSELSEAWKTLLADKLRVENPSSEELVRLLNIESLDADNAGLKTLEPLRLLNKLRALNVSNNNIKSLLGISELKNLTSIMLNNTNVSDLSILKTFTKLERIEAENTKVREVSMLTSLKDMNYLNVDGATIDKASVYALLASNPSLKVRFQTGALNRWWSSLSEDFKRFLGENMKLTAKPSSDELHQLISLKQIEINGPLNSEELIYFDEFFQLESLVLVRTGLTDLDQLSESETLKSLSITETPLDGLISLLKFKSLTKLDISNTPINDLEPLSSLTQLRELNFSGTTVKRLRGLDELKALEVVDCSNTRVSRLDELLELSALKQVVCFNSRLNSKDIEGLKSAQPKVSVVYY